MITIISGTNRAGSLTLDYARHFQSVLSDLGEAAELLDLSEVQPDFFSKAMYDPNQMDHRLLALQDAHILRADKLVILCPEYNGSYPGILKLFIDGISVREYSRNFQNKVVALIGISSGRAGNLRGLDHLADTVAHMGGWVLPTRLPISLADGLLTDGRLTDEATLKSLKQHAQQLIAARFRTVSA